MEYSKLYLQQLHIFSTVKNLKNSYFQTLKVENRLSQRRVKLKKKNQLSRKL